jgi:acyl-CoA synthetase (AMP-forming)/AMP-acid ligase II
MFLLHEIFDWLAIQDPGAEVCRDEAGRVQTRADLRERSNRIANALISMGIGRGDRIAVLAKNCLDYPALYLGTAKAGVALVPLNYRLAPGEWTYIVNNAEAKLVIARKEYVEAVANIREELKTVEHFVALDSDAPDDWLPFDEWMSAQPATKPDVELATSDVYIWMQSSDVARSRRRSRTSSSQRPTTASRCTRPAPPGSRKVSCSRTAA